MASVRSPDSSRAMTERVDLDMCTVPGHIARFISYLIDSALFFGVAIVVGVVGKMVLVGDGEANEVLSLLGVGLLWLSPAVLGGLFEGSGWHTTPGKRIFGMKVIRRDGAYPTMKEALLRNFAKWLGLSMCNLLMLSVFFDDFDRGTWDVVSNTLVVRVVSG